MAQSDIVLGQSPGQGRGVFAARRFSKGELIELCPVIVLSESDAEKLNDTHLYNYYFGWGDQGKAAAIAGGFGCFYNHSNTPNAFCQKILADDAIRFVAAVSIEPGEEIRFEYSFGYAAGGKPWFEVL